MRFYCKHIAMAIMASFLLALSVSAFAQNQTVDRSGNNGYRTGYSVVNDDLRKSAQRHYPGSPTGASPFAPAGTNFDAVFDTARRQLEQSATYREIAERQRLRAAQEEAIRSRDEFQWYRESDPQVHADPEAPDQSELLKNSKDRDFILRNFRTMYVDARDARYFSNALMKGALGKNPEFQKLNIRIVDDPSVADAVLRVSYTFAWEYPFELMHRNTTIVLLSGKGEGPFSGPLGAADVARNFVNAAKSWREVKKANGK
ncbi:MAG TPA: hypothetical protein VKV30_10865 [Candidatus Angelobacter sp.]|nr:hypothetical protein [Candidatus Angelobacter sp.]